MLTYRHSAWQGYLLQHLKSSLTDSMASVAPQMLEAVALEAGLADLARQALSSDPEAAAQLKRYEAAVVRLEKAKAAEKELEVIMKVCVETWAQRKLYSKSKGGSQISRADNDVQGLITTTISDSSSRAVDFTAGLSHAWQGGKHCCIFSLEAARKLQSKCFERYPLVIWHHNGFLQGLCVTEKGWGCPLRTQCHNNCNIKEAQPCPDMHLAMHS